MRKELRELNNGEAAGMTREAAKGIELPVTEPTEDWRPYAGAESWRMMSERVFRAMGNIAREVEDTGVVVMDGNAGMAAVAWWLGIERTWEKKIAFELDLGSVSVFGFSRWGERMVRQLNDMSHLEPLRGERELPGRNAREVSRRVLAAGKFLDLQVIRYIGKDGQKREWEVAERVGGKSAVMVIAWLKPSERLVLVRQFRPPAGGSVIEFAAGIMNEGETAGEAAVRELREETGYVGRVVDVTAGAFNTPGVSNDAAHVVLMEVDEGLSENANAVARPEEAEEIEVVLVGREGMGEFMRKELEMGGLFDSKVMAYAAGMMG
ncbi:MAG: NUDIX domain-containing protein [Planctomycetota bacterium]|nr:NUDIX domain-containing protein [Planctomycetota bacterium]